MNNITTIEPDTESGAKNALATIETTNLSLLFVPGGVDDILTRIKREAREQAAMLDISTEKNRKAISSLAHKIARSKTALDGAGADLKAEWLAKSNAIDAERRTIRTDLDALKAEISKPVDDYEAAIEAKRKLNEDAVAAMEALAVGVDGLTSGDILERRGQLAVVAEFGFSPEFVARAARVRDGISAQLEVAHRSAAQREELAAAEVKRLAEEAETARLAAIEAHRLREERIATEAAEAARVAAEAKAAREAQEQAAAVLLAQQEAERLAQAERDAAARREQEAAEALAAAAERERLAQVRAEEAAVRANERRIAEHKAAIESLRRLAAPLEPPDPLPVIDAKIKQLADIFDNRDWEEFADEAGVVGRASGSVLALARDQAVALAAKQEADRIQAQHDRDEAARTMAEARARQELVEQQAAEQAAAEKRAANRAHQARVNGDAKADIAKALEVARAAAFPNELDDMTAAHAVVVALAKNEIRHVRVEY